MASDSLLKRWVVTWLPVGQPRQTTIVETETSARALAFHQLESNPKLDIYIGPLTARIRLSLEPKIEEAAFDKR